MKGMDYIMVAAVVALATCRYDLRGCFLRRRHGGHLPSEFCISATGIQEENLAQSHRMIQVCHGFGKKYVPDRHNPPRLPGGRGANRSPTHFF